jgi:hypothetical protein
MQSISCAICESPLRAEIEKLDSKGKVDSTVQWARKQGLNISRFSLLKHRNNHLIQVSSGDNGNNKPSELTNTDDIVVLRPINIRAKDQPQAPPRKPSAKKHDKNPIDKSGNGSAAQTAVVTQIESTKLSAEIAAKSPDIESQIPKPIPTEFSGKITDQLLLDTVRDQVYQKLIDGQIKLDIGDCFKAIEIKYKIAEESQNEKLLLEILNEIRSQELAG